MDPETASVVAVRWDLVVLDLVDMRGMGHCSWRESVGLVGRQLVTLGEVPEQMALEMHVHPDLGMEQESYGQ